MQVLSDLAPGIKVIAVLLNPDTPFSTLALQELRPGAEARGQRLELCEVRTADRLSTSVEAAARAGRLPRLPPATTEAPAAEETPVHEEAPMTEATPGICRCGRCSQPYSRYPGHTENLGSHIP